MKFRGDNREEYVCVQMLNIHLLSRFSREYLCSCMNVSPINYLPITESEGKLFQYINKFHSNGYLSKSNQLDYSNADSSYITPFIPFCRFYQFICPNYHFINKNNFYFQSNQYKTNSEREREDVINKPSSNVNRCNNSLNEYNRSIIYRGKKIVSYVTSSSLDTNETLICLAIKDIVSIYFPCLTEEEFIHLCRLKQIIRYKPDLSTNTDLTLRLINIQDLNRNWNFFNQQILNNQITTSNLTINKTDQLSICSTNLLHQQSMEKISETMNSTNDSEQENLISQIDTDRDIHMEIKNFLNEILDTLEQQEQKQKEEEKVQLKMKSELINNSRNNQVEDKIILQRIENKQVKRKRYRSEKFYLKSKEKKCKESNEEMETWIEKYSIEPISIFLQRIHFPTD